MNTFRKCLIVITDIFLVNVAYLLAINLAFTDEFTKIATIYAQDFLVISIIYLISFISFQMYNSLWLFTGTDEFLLSVSGTVVGGIVTILYTRFLGATVPINVCVLGTLLITVLLLGYRVLFRVYRRMLLYLPYRDADDQTRALIVGAGSAGTMIINEMMARRELKYNPQALIDDSSYKIGKRISSVKVMGNRYDIPRVVKDKKIDEIIIAIPSIDEKNRKEIINIAQSTKCKVKIVPGIYEIISGDATVSRIKNVELEDLLGREQVKLNKEGISEYLYSKVVLVTGAGGTIGSELCRQIMKYNPKILILFDIYENSVYEIQNELKNECNDRDIELKVLIGSVRDRERLEEIFTADKIDVVFHAAAHKHVPLMEDSPKEAVKNNVFGTLNLAQVADKFNISRFVLISTDKAVNPTNIMGASKRLCEMIIQAVNANSKTEFVAVRFGNVLGSNGSVIPLFNKQIKQGGPVTVTHKEITRYFMLIPEAAQLVLQAGAFAKGGEIFVLDMGEPVKIYDLACDLIKLSGFEPNKDIKIVFTGLRPGEKLYEELLMSEEGLAKTTHKKIFIGKPTFENLEKLEKRLSELREEIGSGNDETVKEKMKNIVPTYKSPNEVNKKKVKG